MPLVNILSYRNRNLSAVLCSLTFALFVQSESFAQSSPAASQLWFSDLPAEPVPAPLRDGAVNCVKAALAGRNFQSEPAYQELARDTAPRILFLSVSDGKGPARVQVASEKGMGAALKKLLELQPLKPAGENAQWTRFDIVEHATRIPGAAWLFPVALGPGLEGLAFSKESQVAFLPQEIFSYDLLSPEALFREENLKAHAGGRALPKDLSEFYRFTTTSFFFEKGEAIPLYRGHRLIPPVTPDQVLETARNAGKYLTRAVQQDGSFIYDYHAAPNVVPPGYNILRHAGTAYSMFELYAVTRDEELLQAGKRALEFLIKQIQPKNIDGEEVALLVEKDEAKLGGNGLAIIALTQYTVVTGDKQHLPLMKRLGRWIQKIQDKDGRFTVHKLDVSTGKAAEFESRYYPGEAILSMMRLHSITREETWVDTAYRGASHLIMVRDKGIAEDKIAHDHWLLYALNELHRAKPRKEFLDHAMLITRAIIKFQISNAKYPDWNGGFRPPPTSNPVATRTEGLCAAYQLARDYQQPELAQLRPTIHRALTFQLQLMQRPEAVMYFKDPQRCLGAFTESFIDSSIRIDTQQHSISALVNGAKILKEPESK